MRQALLRAFLAFDSSAIRFNERYQAVLYWRAILPFVSTLLIPALGAHFSTKLTLCNFRFDRGYHHRMLELLREEQKRLERLCSLDGPIPAEAVRELGEDLAKIMLLQDTSQWFQQYESATVTRL